MGYWGQVEKRARREALEMLRLEHPGRAALTLGLIGAPAVLTWFGAHDVSAWVRALATAGALGICGLIAYGAKLLSVPPVMAAEGESEKVALAKQLASFDGPEDDAGLSEGIAYAIGGAWGSNLWDQGPDVSLVYKIANRVRKLVVQERLHIWGTAGGGNEVHQLVPVYFLQATAFDFTTLTLVAENVVRTEKNQAYTPSRWHYLRVNKAEFEREFPTPLTLEDFA
jgi:hypothetical protein